MLKETNDAQTSKSKRNTFNHVESIDLTIDTLNSEKFFNTKLFIYHLDRYIRSFSTFKNGSLIFAKQLQESILIESKPIKFIPNIDYP